MRGKRLGLVLGAGSYRGLIHIGVLQVLEENNIPIDYIGGSSIGALISSFYAMGYNGEKIEEIAMDFVRELPFTLSVDPGKAFLIFIKAFLKRAGLFPADWVKVPLGLIDGKKIVNYLYKYLGDLRFEDLEKPLIIVSTDLRSGEGIAFVPANFHYNTRSLNDTVYYYNEPVIDAVMASISIPGIFVPYLWNERYLIDGAVKNSLPVDIMSLMKPDVILACDLGYNSQDDEKIWDPLSAAIQTLDIMGQEISSLNLQKYADIIIKPEISNINIKDLNSVKNAINIGRRTGLKAVPTIKAMLRI